jgi:hypothetical protein
MHPGQFCADVPNGFRQRGHKPQSISKIAVEVCPYAPRFESADLFPKNMLRDGVNPVCAVKRREPDPWLRDHASLGLRRMSIGQVERNEEAGVGVDTQA